MNEKNAVRIFIRFITSVYSVQYRFVSSDFPFSLYGEWILLLLLLSKLHNFGADKRKQLLTLLANNHHHAINNNDKKNCAQMHSAHIHSHIQSSSLFVVSIFASSDNGTECNVYGIRREKWSQSSDLKLTNAPFIGIFVRVFIFYICGCVPICATNNVAQKTKRNKTKLRNATQYTHNVWLSLDQIHPICVFMCLQILSVPCAMALSVIYQKQMKR